MFCTSTCIFYLSIALIIKIITIQVSLLGTPAEEEHGGKIDFIKAGVFKDVDAAMMAHPAQYEVLRPNYVAISE